MKRLLMMVAVTACMTLLSFSVIAGAAEHAGSPLGGEHPGREISARTVKKGIKDHVKTLAAKNGGVLIVHDDKLNKNWHLKLDKVHDPVRTFKKDLRTIYFACSDFKSVDSPDVLDIDFWMVDKGGSLEVVDTKIHKLNGVPRYTYEGTTIREIK